jgi:ABC-2 type transport system permease protein
MIPGLIGTLSLVTALLTTAMSIAREREQGTLDQLLVTPLRPIEFLIGKVVPGFAVGLFEAAVIVTAAELWFRIPFQGSVLTLTIVVATFLFSAVALGLMISSLAVTMQQALLGTFMFMMPAAILSGFTTPISSMPPLVQHLTLINPLRYAVSMSRRVFLEGATLADVSNELWPMAVIGVVSVALAGWLVRRRAA